MTKRRITHIVWAWFWGLLPEPRVISPVMIAAWTTLAVIGTIAAIDPPRSVTGELGPVMALVWGLLLAAGGVLGVTGCLSHFWWVERAAIFLALGGATIYLSTIIHLHLVEQGNRLIQAGFVALAILFLLTRLLRIWGLQTDPRRPRR